jgi:hypothetical protein
MSVRSAHTSPQYTYMSDFDFQSLNLGLNQELIELNLFHYALAKFSVQEFEEAGITAEDRYLIEFMADQEVGHATVINDMLQLKGAKQCKVSFVRMLCPIACSLAPAVSVPLQDRARVDRLLREAHALGRVRHVRLP